MKNPLDPLRHSTLTTDDLVYEVASGLNDQRPKLRKLLGDHTVHTIIVEHRERVARFGAGMVESMLQAQGGSLIVIDDAEVPGDLCGT